MTKFKLGMAAAAAAVLAFGVAACGQTTTVDRTTAAATRRTDTPMSTELRLTTLRLIGDVDAEAPAATTPTTP